jgi:RNA polymerase subunit RPABC4/transcription elongation factor Spt4
MFTTDLGSKYIVKFEEVSEGIWTLNFQLESGEPLRSEIFKTMKFLGDNTSNFLDEKGINTLLVYIVGSDRSEIDQKTKIFTRWIKSPWKYEVISNPIITIEGNRDYIETNTNFIHMTRGVEEVVINESPIGSKFCFNCGLENNNYKFCPSCGTNLKQA